MESLPIFVRLRGQPVLLIGDGAAADAKARLIEGAGAVVVRSGAARIAFVALEDPAMAEEAAARLKAEGRLVNVVDRPALCDFTIPAIVDRSPVIVAVGTGGASASLAKALRERLEALLPAGLGKLAQSIFAARAAIAGTHPTIDARRRFWDAALAPGGPLDPFSDRCDVNTALQADTSGPPESALVEIVLTSPDPDDLTLRQLRTLNQADTIFYDGEVPAAVLDRTRRDAERIGGSPETTRRPGKSVLLKLNYK